MHRHATTHPLPLPFLIILENLTLIPFRADKVRQTFFFESDSSSSLGRILQRDGKQQVQDLHEVAPLDRESRLVLGVDEPPQHRVEVLVFRQGGEQVICGGFTGPDQEFYSEK